MSFSFGQATTTTGGTFGTNTPSGSLFGGGDASKISQSDSENKPSLFGSPQTSTPAFGGFSFGAKTTAASSNLFSTPSTTTSAFGASKPLPFGGFTSPPVQTVGSPGFGQSPKPANAADTKPPAFGATQQTSAFGSPTTQAPAFGSPANSNLSFGKPGGGFNFTTPTFGGFAQVQPTATTTTATTTQSFGLGASPQTNFGNTAFGGKPFGTATTAAPAFGTTTSSSGFSFGQAQSTPQTTQNAQNQSYPFASQNQTPAFGTQTTQSLSFGQPTQANLTSAFSSQPTQANQTSAFSAQPTQSNQTSAFSAQPTQTQGTGFGPATTQSNFMTQTTQATGFGTSQPQTTQSFGSTQTLNFSKPQTSQPISFGGQTQTQTPAFGQTQTSQPSFGTTQASMSFGTSTQPTSTFGTTTQPNQTTSFGTTQPTSTFGVTSQPQQISTFGTTQPTSTFGATTQPTSSFAPTQTTQANLSFGTTQATTAGLSFGTTTQSQSNLSFGTSTAQPTSSFGTTSTLSFGGNQTSQASTVPSTTQSGFGFGTTSTTTSFSLNPGLSFGKTTSTTAATTSSAAPSGITALGKSTAMASLTTTTTTTASGPPAAISSITFAQLEENINKWSLELNEQESNFIKQATMINAWDRLLVANGEKILELNDAVEAVKSEQTSLEHELDFILAQQKELEELLKPLEKQLLEDTGDRMRDPEREHMYTLAETLDTQLRQMSEDLKEVIEHINETNRSQDSNDPIVQIGRILSAHMSSMQWVESGAAHIAAALHSLQDETRALRQRSEAAFQRAYH